METTAAHSFLNLVPRLRFGFSRLRRSSVMCA
jgi:hypothetical protein